MICGQHRAGDVFAGLGVVGHEIAALLDHLGEVVEGDIAARRGVVEPPVGVFLDDDGLAGRPACRCSGCSCAHHFPSGSLPALRQYSVSARSPYQSRANRLGRAFAAVTAEYSAADDRRPRPRAPLSGAVGGVSGGAAARSRGRRRCGVRLLGDCGDDRSDARKPQPGSPAGAAAAAGASDERSRSVAELARRVAVLEDRIAALERARPASGAHSRAKSTHSGLSRFAAALDAEIGRRATAFITGLEAYRRHPYRRAAAAVPVVWAGGRQPRSSIIAATIRRAGGAGRAVADQPLLRPRSVARAQLSCAIWRGKACARWSSIGASRARPNAARSRRLRRTPRPRFCRRRRSPRRRPIAVVGYCMGGLLALALALRRQRQVACLALLATPWDFHAERADPAASARAF